MFTAMWEHKKKAPNNAWVSGLCPVRNALRAAVAALGLAGARCCVRVSRGVRLCWWCLRPRAVLASLPRDFTLDNPW